VKMPLRAWAFSLSSTMMHAGVSVPEGSIPRFSHLMALSIRFRPPDPRRKGPRLRRVGAVDADHEIAQSCAGYPGGDYLPAKNASGRDAVTELDLRIVTAEVESERQRRKTERHRRDGRHGTQLL